MQVEVCFRPTLEQGENRFRAVATVEGDQDEMEISRNTLSDREQATQLSPTGGFFSSTSGTIAAAISIIAIITALIAKRRGIGAMRVFNN